uniref:Inhibitor of nuclear factor kappa-B kinase subunit alpha n=1 Tax=Callorhinchus milii TaxID=7868 RepID=A0A4W3IGT7_CALMI
MPPPTMQHILVSALECHLTLCDTIERIAVKVCRLELSARNKQRWCHEIQIMEKLSHPNVVAAREVPVEMKSLAINDVPFLVMEYCSGGDLRKLLNKPENCCGLKESQVLSLLHDVGSGIQYLHEHRIIHRDLKPENIVLQETNGKFVHKIIDLGYAKDLDQGSLCTSFVGTLQYLAPELFDRNLSYTVTVDYWSFGTLLFECISGFRPFLHNQQPIQWHSKVKLKGPKDITGIEGMNGETSFSMNLPQPNCLSSFITEQLESLLQVLLRWDPIQRGGSMEPTTNRATCFMLMDTILSQKYVHILNMTSARIHSFLIKPDESLLSLQMHIETETGIAAANQELLLETGISLDPRKPASQCVLDGVVWSLKFIRSATIISVLKHLVQDNSSVYEGPFAGRKLPEHVNYVVRDAKVLLPNVQLRKVWGEAVNYVCGLKDDYSRLFQGQRAAMLSLLRYNSNLTKMKMTMFSNSQQLKAKLDFFQCSIKLDLEKYSEQMAYGICKYCSAAEIGHLEERIVGLHSEIVELQRSPYARRHGEVMEAFKLLACKQKIIDLLPNIEQTLDNIRENEKMLLRLQEKRQKEIWYLLKIACSTARGPGNGSPESSGSPHGLGWTQQGETLMPQGSMPDPLTSMPVLKNRYNILLH